MEGRRRPETRRLVTVVLLFCALAIPLFAVAGCGKQLARMEENQVKLQAMIAANAREIATVSSQLHTGQGKINQSIQDLDGDTRQVAANVVTPAPQADEITIDVHAAGVNFPDLLVVRGSYQNLAPLPFCPGKEIAGIVSAVGPDVTEFWIGQHVLCFVENGGYVDRITVPTFLCHPMPDRLDFADAIGVGLAFRRILRLTAARAGLSSLRRSDRTDWRAVKFTNAAIGWHAVPRTGLARVDPTR